MLEQLTAHVTRLDIHEHKMLHSLFFLLCFASLYSIASKPLSSNHRTHNSVLKKELLS